LRLKVLHPSLQTLLLATSAGALECCCYPVPVFSFKESESDAFKACAQQSILAAVL